MFRGILTTIYLELKPGNSLNKAHKLLKEFYKKDKFIKVLNRDSLVSTNEKQHNNCHLSNFTTKYKNKMIILSAIDNLIKNFSCQAIKNMNLRYNFRIGEGLK